MKQGITLRLCSKWYESLLWCPTQCYADIVTATKERFVLYLRWRGNPWETRIFRTSVRARYQFGSKAGVIANRSPELFLHYRININGEDSLQEAKHEAAKVAERWLNDRESEWEGTYV